MIQVSYYKEPIGIWSYENEQDISSPLTFDNLIAVLRDCEQIIAHLHKQALFQPMMIMFSGWINPKNRAKGILDDFSKLSISLSHIDWANSSLSTVIKSFVTRFHRSGTFLYPTNFQIDGQTVIQGTKNLHVVPNAINILVTTALWHTVYIQTFVDAWLPYDLFGKEQTIVSNNNAPRLKGALQEIDSALGIEAEESNQYAHIRSYGLENYQDNDGNPISIFPQPKVWLTDILL